MKCRKCNSDVLQSFRFCHDCGNALDEDLPKNESIVSVDANFSRHAAHSATSSRGACPVSNNSQSHPATRVLSFDEFRKRKSNERVEHTAKKKQQKPPKDVLIGIGIMALTKRELKPVKGKVKMVRVAANIRKLDPLRVSYMAFCRGQKCEQQYFNRTRIFRIRTRIFRIRTRIFRSRSRVYKNRSRKQMSRSRKYEFRSRQEMQNYNRKETEVIEVRKQIFDGREEVCNFNREEADMRNTKPDLGYKSGDITP